MEGRKKKKMKFYKLVFWGEEISSHEGETRGMDGWLDSKESQDILEVTRDWLLEVETPGTKTGLRQTKLDEVVKVVANKKDGKEMVKTST